MPFFNIFSKEERKKEKTGETNKPQIIIIDNREKNSLVPSELISLGFKVDFQQLPIGDYIVNGIIIERKAIQDLKSSIINKRLVSQLENLKQYPNYILIIEGIKDCDIYQGIMHENAFRGFLLSLALNKTPLIFSQDEKDTAKYLSILAKKKEKSLPSLRQSRIFKTKKEQIQFILEGFPNVGPVTAKKLLKEFKTIKNIINAPEEKISKILGKKTENFRQLIE